MLWDPCGSNGLHSSVFLCLTPATTGREPGTTSINIFPWFEWCACGGQKVLNNRVASSSSVELGTLPDNSHSCDLNWSFRKFVQFLTCVAYWTCLEPNIRIDFNVQSWSVEISLACLCPVLSPFNLNKLISPQIELSSFTYENISIPRTRFYLWTRGVFTQYIYCLEPRELL